ncbi:Putative sterol carrier protein [Bhargavaea ginsengi]|uniref:Putative sterol carrier protein n=1 Tax=Bhargavaea ginsengi TaxID=426757 RepID=A0A1H6TCE2_9BACL|nr:SCP2 sterol-binding domain-containing protein [Bhargavaea ginsengi]SEI77729.1 Putative sterol carrier protein [Bhargavaea ginsengi]
MGNPLNALSLDEIWAKIGQELEAKPEPYQDEHIRYEFIIDEKGEVSRWQLLFENGRAEIFSGVAGEASCTLEMSGKHFRKLLTGDLNSMAAFTIGKLKVRGNVGFALKLENLLKEYQFAG